MKKADRGVHACKDLRDECLLRSANRARRRAEQLCFVEVCGVTRAYQRRRRRRKKLRARLQREREYVGIEGECRQAVGWRCWLPLARKRRQDIVWIGCDYSRPSVILSPIQDRLCGLAADCYSLLRQSDWNTGQLRRKSIVECAFLRRKKRSQDVPSRLGSR